MKNTFILLSAVFTLGAHAQAIKPEHNAIACLSVDKATGVKSLISFVQGDEEAVIVGADEKNKRADKSSLAIDGTVTSGELLKVTLVESMETDIRGSLQINTKTGAAKLSQNLAYTSEYRLFYLTFFNCYGTTFKKINEKDRFRSNTFLRTLGLPAINTNIQYKNVACTEWDNFCWITIKL